MRKVPIPSTTSSMLTPTVGVFSWLLVFPLQSKNLLILPRVKGKKWSMKPDACVRQQCKKLRRKLKLCLTTLSTAASAAASNIISVSMRNAMWLFFLPQPRGISSFLRLPPSHSLYSFCPTPPIYSCPCLTIFTPPCSMPASTRHSPYQHVVADFLEFRLDLHTVIAGHLLFLLIPLRLLLNTGDDTPGWTTGSHLTATNTLSTYSWL